ncbi:MULTISPECIES: hypothetical protein [unclassified Streptomyces]|uniref:hypothetical protein n=1 Tax=unclassified Streptomyces TaxID=2593676 RepID=UPI002E2BBA8A|nr:hypothetical protein [Streptomyces sp. NBC_00273]
MLTSDGVHNQIEPDDLDAIIRTHQHDAQHLADTLVAAAEPNESGYRDDATALVIIPARTTPGSPVGDEVGEECCEPDRFTAVRLPGGTGRVGFAGTAGPLASLTGRGPGGGEHVISWLPCGWCLG